MWEAVRGSGGEPLALSLLSHARCSAKRDCLHPGTCLAACLKRQCPDRPRVAGASQAAPSSVPSALNINLTARPPEPASSRYISPTHVVWPELAVEVVALRARSVQCKRASTRPPPSPVDSNPVHLRPRVRSRQHTAGEPVACIPTTPSSVRKRTRCVRDSRAALTSCARPAFPVLRQHGLSSTFLPVVPGLP
jgi:hypothetical protein